MLRTAETSPQFRLLLLTQTGGGKSLFVPFKICVHILQGITVYLDTPSDLVD